MSKKGVWTIHFLLWLDMLSSNDGCECIFNVGLPIHGNNHPHIQRYFYFILVQLSLVCLLFIKLPLWLPGSIGASWCDQFNPLQTSEISVVTLSAFTKKIKISKWIILLKLKSTWRCRVSIFLRPWAQLVDERKNYRYALHLHHAMEPKYPESMAFSSFLKENLMHIETLYTSPLMYWH